MNLPEFHTPQKRTGMARLRRSAQTSDISLAVAFKPKLAIAALW